MNIKIKEKWGWRDNIKIYVYDLEGKIIGVKTLHNSLMNVAFNLGRDALAGLATDLQLKYLAWGTDNTAVNVAQTALVAESGRKAITLQAAGATGIMVSTTYLSPFDAVGVQIEELGWFAGPAATAVAGTGIMVARALYSHLKTGIENINVVRSDFFA
jgi:hypothetical protein